MTRINSFQIRPSANPGDVIATLGGEQGEMSIVAGAGVTVSLSGNVLTISAAVPLAISSFTGAQTVALGASIVNPAFAATYNQTLTSAAITNTDGTGSPLNLTTPFTSGTVTGTFTKTTPTTLPFTLTAVKGSDSPTAVVNLVWAAELFGGVGTPGASSSVTASGTTAVLSTSDVLARSTIGSVTVGETFGPYAPSGQAVYLLLTGGSHTFKDAVTGFPIPFNTPTAVSFVNTHGVTVSMFLYQSTNTLFGSVSPQVTA